MKYTVRPYQESDFKEIASWWKHQTEQDITPNMMSVTGTFILELDDKPALSLTALATQCKDIAYITQYIKNPEFKTSLEGYGHVLWNHCYEFLKNLGHTRVICFAENEKLIEKYQKFGMSKNYTSLTSFVRIF